MKGWVYVITNESLPGLVKIGFTLKDPAQRAAELGSTGVPAKYEVAYEILVNNPRDLENRAHRRLDEFREGKEWFRCTIEQAVICIKEITQEDFLLESHVRSEKLAVESEIDLKKRLAKKLESDIRKAEEERAEIEHAINAGMEFFEREHPRLGHIFQGDFVQGVAVVIVTYLSSSLFYPSGDVIPGMIVTLLPSTGFLLLVSKVLDLMYGSEKELAEREKQKKAHLEALEKKLGSKEAAKCEAELKERARKMEHSISL